MYDINFISCGELNSEKNYQHLRSRFPIVKRIRNIAGIHNAHIAAAQQSFTSMIWIVDADAVIDDNFNFDFLTDKDDTVYVWHSKNPINDLEYGYGGVKLFPRKMLLNVDTTTLDMTTSISKYFSVIPIVSNITEFNTDPFNTWKSAFRECVKLASKSINRQLDEESEFRLKVWCEKGSDRNYGNYSILGANQAKKFVEDNPNDLLNINNFEWLKEQFKKVSL
jgi:hypothetical protein